MYEYIPDSVLNAFEESNHYFPTQLQKFQFYDKYARWNYDEGRRETWKEAVKRTVDFLRELSDNKLDDSVYEKIQDYILTMRSMPSMRLLAMAGTAARRNNICLYNCAYLPVDSLESFVEAMLISMCGSGIGYSLERHYVHQLPKVKIQYETTKKYHIIEDSTEGWCDALRFGLENWFNGYDVDFNYNLIRPAGAVLKVKGGRASGPAPLKMAIERIRKIILNRQDSYLKTIDAHDIMCHIGQASISGGVRRTALIALFDFDDYTMRNCKSPENIVGNEQRWNANNSTVWSTKKLSTADLMQQMLTMDSNMMGEPGIFNRSAVNNLKPERRLESRFGSNPCLTADTKVQTKNGHFNIEDLVGETVEIWNGEDWQTVDNFRVTGRNQETLKITLHDGSEIKCTPYHNFILEDGERITAEELSIGDRLKISDAPNSFGNKKINGAYAKGFMLGDGTSDSDRNYPILYLYHPKYMLQDRLINSFAEIEPKKYGTYEKYELDVNETDIDVRKVFIGISCRREELIPYVYNIPDEMFEADYESICEFIAGYMDADGTASDTTNGWMYQISSISKENLIKFQQILKMIGVQSTLRLNRLAGKKDFNDGYGEYETQELYRLTISQESSIILSKQISFGRLESFADKQTTYKLKTRWNKIASIEANVIADKVYCCTVEGNHQFSLTNCLDIAQCNEISLRPRQFCNLSVAVAREDDTFESLKNKVEVATIIGTIQSMATYFPGLSDEWEKNALEERLLGVDITGILDCILTQDASVLSQLKQVAIDTNKVYAKLLSISESTAITTVKPSGNSSVLLDCSPGMHARHSPFYIRNVRVNKHTPVYDVLKEARVPMDPENGQTIENATMYVAHFPVKSPLNAIVKCDLSAIDQCEIWLRTRLNWTEHNVSCTVTYKSHELIELTKWIWDNREQVSGISFLPASDAHYDQMPYEEITQEEYEKLNTEFPEIDFSLLYLYEKEDYTTAAQEVACVGGICEII